MRKIISYIAQSVDGKIARSDGNVDWLDKIPNPGKTDYGYAQFYDSVDTTIMGSSTYRKILDFNIPFPYPDKTNYVLTQKKYEEKQPHVTFCGGDAPFFNALKSGKGKNIWLIGGAKTNAWFFQHNLIDEMYLFVMPVIIGNGIPLFDNGNKLWNIHLISSEAYVSGAVLLKYRFLD